MNSELGPGTRQSSSEFRRELGTRLRVVEKSFRNREDAAAAAGVAKSTLQSWLEGARDPSFEGLSRLAGATGFSLDWLATGNGPMRAHDETAPVPAANPKARPNASGIDEALMGRLIDGITAVYKELGQAIAPVHLGQLAGRLYNEIVAAADEPEDFPGAIKMRLAQLRQDLRAAAVDPGNTKRRA